MSWFYVTLEARVLFDGGKTTNNISSVKNSQLVQTFFNQIEFVYKIQAE